MARVLLTHPVPEGGTDPILAAGHELVRAGGADPDLVGLAPGVDGVLCMLTDRIDGAVLRAGAAGRLRVVSVAAVGYDNVDVAEAAALGITVCNTPGVLDETTADLAFLLILATGRLASDAEADLRAGRWEGWGITDHLGRDVHGTCLGLVGYGRIAGAVARRAEGFNMEVLHHARRDTGLPGYVAELADLLARSDTVSLHVPLTPSTRHLIGAAELRLMKPTAVLVNTARGAVVDEAALARALEKGELFAAGLDVYSAEPAVAPELLAAPRTVLLPHIGSASTQTRTAMAQMASQAVCDVLAGRPPAHPVGA
ncbi:MAG TPA: D-glycerate dehydrogenase [Acidimicrobiales bacterium]|nr:D-glycerate dehydrogenase [Acidimicrobiales bacterium]